ncbi:MAG: carbohydrate porin [Maricaulis sp.]|jgi:carbohydrate-selective porin OprB|nr:carbohydrate porin [Maricaulis sp.]MDG2044686.1 carbohydrate porin [Maricaulis sp.]
MYFLKSSFQNGLCASLLGFLIGGCAVAEDVKTGAVTFGLSYAAGHSFEPLGPEDGGSTSKQRLTLNFEADLERAWGWQGASLFVQYQNHSGVPGAREVGDIQVYDGLDDPEYDRIHMAWLQQHFFGDTLRVKLGKVEPKSEFFAPTNATHHLGFSTERSPTIIAQGPPSLSANFFYHPSDQFSIGLGIYDAAWNNGFDENSLNFHNVFSDLGDLAIFLEARYSFKSGRTRLKVGGWRLDGALNRFDGTSTNGAEGLYLVLDHDLSDQVGLYAQLGFADSSVSALTQHFGAGLQWQGPLNIRPDDIFGFGVSRVSFSDDVNAPFTQEAETAYEVFYKMPVGAQLVLQANFQFIDNPGGTGRSDALVPTIRGTINF